MNRLFTAGYILKCVNNPDLQENWTPQKGQRCVDGHNSCGEGNTVGFFVANYTTNTHKNIEDVIWVPRQDELQVLIKEKRDRFKKMSDLKFDFNMRACVFKTYCYKISSVLTLNDMWLIFYMQELFGKQWVPESKCWQKR